MLFLNYNRLITTYLNILDYETKNGVFAIY